MRNTRNWTEGQKWQLAAETGFACAYCQVIFGSVVRRPGHDSEVTRLELDHIVPVSWSGHEGGEVDVVASCQVCNGLKGDRLFDSVDNARRHIDRLWVRAHYVVEFIPTRSNFEDPDGWAIEFARHMRITGIREDSE